MAYVTIPSSSTDVGSPITKDLMDKIRTNADDHESRISDIEAASSSFQIVNGDLNLSGFDISSPNIFYYKVRSDIVVTDFRVQLFTKDGVSSGVLSFDLQKSTNTNDANFQTVLISALTFDFAVDADYAEKVSSLDPTKVSITNGSVVRIKINSVPTGFRGSILISLGKQ